MFSKYFDTREFEAKVLSLITKPFNKIMSDSEYSSEDDEDYIPDAESGSEEDDFEGQGKTVGSKDKASKRKQVAKRKRRGGIKLEDEEIDEEENDEDQSDDHDDNVETEEGARKKQEEEEKAKKARMEDLWASFKSDTAKVRAKSSNRPTSTEATPSKAVNINTSVTDSKRATSSASIPGKSPAAAKVTITKTYDFAGEAVTVTKTVDADSSEAKESAKEKQDLPQQEKQQATSSPISTNVRGIKRPGGLGSVLGQLGKKPKISTLDKSKLDWENFKSETGISDELRNYNKNGYLEKQDFLQRTDHRLFEREKAARNAMRK